MGDLLDVNKEVPEGIRVMKNGAWQDKETGRIVKAPPGNGWDSEEASKMAKRRHYLAKERTRQAIAEAVLDSDDISDVVDAFPKAHGEVIKILMRQVVLNPGERGKTRIDTYKTITDMEGSLRKGLSMDEMEGSGMTISFDQDVAKAMMELMIQHRGNGQ